MNERNFFYKKRETDPKDAGQEGGDTVEGDGASDGVVEGRQVRDGGQDFRDDVAQDSLDIAGGG